MKRILGIAMVLGFVGAVTLIAGCSKGKEVNLGKGIKVEMVLIPAGNFIMGSPLSDKGGSMSGNLHAGEENQREVTLTKPYYLGKYEVTQEQWEAVMGDNPSKVKGANFPVTNVSWQDCQDFITKLNAKTDGGYRLPTEAEWECACRASTTTVYTFGDKITPKDANYDGSKIGKPVAVGSYKPNVFGLFDMHGNAWEWCEDRYNPNIYPKDKQVDPKGPEKGTRYVNRGGSFNSLESAARSSKRSGDSPTVRHDGNGFRLARTK